MKREKKILSVLLACIAILCLIAAGALIITQVRDNIHTQDTLEDLRASADAIKGSRFEASSVCERIINIPSDEEGKNILNDISAMLKEEML